MGAVARGQWRQITTKQLLSCGLTETQIRGRVERGLLHPGPRGIYSVGTPARTVEEKTMAATLAIEGGVLGARSASDLTGLWTNVRSREVVFSPRKARARDDIDVRHRRLDPQDITTHKGIRVTKVPRTLLDLAAELAPNQLRDALVRARVDHFITDDAIRDVLARHPRHPGTKRLGAAFTGPATHTELERDLLTLLTGQRDLPRPLTQARIGAIRCDFVFPDHKLVIEVDGPHHAFEWAADAAKQARLEAAGWTVLRLTDWDINHDSARTLARIRAALRVPR